MNVSTVLGEVLAKGEFEFLGSLCRNGGTDAARYAHLANMSEMAVARTLLRVGMARPELAEEWVCGLPKEMVAKAEHAFHLPYGPAISGSVLGALWYGLYTDQDKEDESFRKALASLLEEALVSQVAYHNKQWGGGPIEAPKSYYVDLEAAVRGYCGFCKGRQAVKEALAKAVPRINALETDGSISAFGERLAVILTDAVYGHLAPLEKLCLLTSATQTKADQPPALALVGS